MSEMVERVANALAARRALAGREEDPQTMARVALEAAREPTQAIKQTVLSSRMDEGWDYDDLGRIWRELIDAALK